MALNIKNLEVEQLAAKIARMTNETKTEAIRRALAERMARLQAARKKSNVQNWVEYLEKEVWPNLPPDKRGRVPTREEEDEILGFGPDGV